MLTSIPFLTFETHLKRSPLQCYVVSGDDFFLKQELFRTLRNHADALGYNSKKSFDFSVKEEIEDCFAHLNSFDLFQDKECIEISLPENSPNKSIQEKLLSIVHAQHPSQLVFLNAPKLDEKNVKAKWLQEGSFPKGLIQIPFFNEKTAAQWLTQKAKENGFTFNPKIIEHIFHRCKNQWFYASQLFDKLSLLGPETTITIALIDELLSDESEFTVFEFMDALLSQNGSEISRRLNALKCSGIDPILILWVITKELRILIHASHDQKKPSFNWFSFCQKHRIFKYREPLIKNTLNHFNLTQLESFLIHSLQIEFSIKGILPIDPWEQLAQFCREWLTK